MLEIDLNIKGVISEGKPALQAKDMKSSSMFKMYFANEVPHPTVMKLLLQSGWDAAQLGRVHLRIRSHSGSELKMSCVLMTASAAEFQQLARSGHTKARHYVRKIFFFFYRRAERA